MIDQQTILAIPDAEIRPCPEVIERMIQLVSGDRPAPSAQVVDSVRRKLREIAFVDLLTLWFRWMWGDKSDKIFAAVENDLFPA